MTEWVELPNQEKVWTISEKKTLKNLGILEEDTIKHAEIK